MLRVWQPAGLAAFCALFTGCNADAAGSRVELRITAEAGLRAEAQQLSIKVSTTSGGTVYERTVPGTGEASLVFPAGPTLVSQNEG